MVETAMLEHLAAFSQCGTLSAAAQQVHLSQPALSQSMKKLEQEVSVPLFIRTKNQLRLNENGKMLAEYAVQLLAMQKEMIEHVRRFDQSSHTLSYGCCAPVPVADLAAALACHFPTLTLSCKMVSNEKELLEGLIQDIYQLVVVTQPSDDPQLFSLAYRTEKLFLSVPLTHPLAKCSELHFADLNGQNLLLYTYIGFWAEVCSRKIPQAHYLMMNERSAFSDVVGTSAFPAFTTDVILKQEPLPSGRKAIPLLDKEACATYYCVCRKSDQARFSALFEQLIATQVVQTALLP